MTEIVNVVVTCTKQKTCDIPEHLRMRSLASGSCAARVRDWIERLTKADDEERVSVSSLYAGDHWSIARELNGLERANFRVQTWVASAGCGMMPLDQLLKPYSATFSTGHPDSVVKGNIRASEWWTALTQDRTRRSLRSVAEEFPGSPMLVAASTTYLTAMRQDIVNSAKSLNSPELLSIVSAGTRSLAELDAHLLPCNARMKNCVGGVLRSLNVRVLRKLLVDARRDLPVFPKLEDRLGKLLAKQPGLEKYDRRRTTDEEVKKYITAAAEEDPQITHSRLLRRFRDAGSACEQGRFRKLFNEVLKQATYSVREG